METRITSVPAGSLRVASVQMQSLAGDKHANLATLETFVAQAAELPPASALDPGTLTVTLIGGGSGLNVVPDACSLSLDRRVVDGERAEVVVAGLFELARIYAHWWEV